MKLTCFHCGKGMTISAEQLGQEVMCPHCHKPTHLPDADQAGDASHDDAHPSPGGSWFSNSVSGMVSLLVHSCLLLVLAQVTCNSGGGGEQLGEEVVIGELPSETLNESAEEQLDIEKANEQVEQTESLDETLEIETPQDALVSEESMMVNIDQLIPSAAGGGGAPEVGAIGGGGGALGEGASFMGVFAKGSRFCIIADNSGSMAGPKLEYVKEEILETITTIRGRGRFQVIFFSGRAMPFPNSTWRHPRKDRAALTSWLNNAITAGGGTNPTPAFKEAFEMEPRPDVIFFMTDGQFDPSAVDQVRRLNGQGSERVAINTISFMDRSAEPQMREIAQQSGGKYRHVKGF